jgi:tripartite-type tricarboxylate transporter receptor subunit TctC
MTSRNYAFGRARMIILAIAAVVSMTGASFGQSGYPNHTIKIVVPLPPGSGPDIVARVLAEKLQAKWGQPVIVENRPGGGFNIGAQAVAAASPDGYTLLLSPPLVSNAKVFANLSYDPAAFEAVSIPVKLQSILVAKADLPVSDLKQLVALTKANPGKLNFATTGRGSSLELSAEMLQREADIKFSFVPYPGVNQAIPDILGGRIDLLLLDYGNLSAHLTSGKIKALGVSGPQRLPELPDVPSIAETYPGYDATTWFAVVAPPKTPAAITTALSEAIAVALQTPEIVSRLKGYAMRSVGTSPAETAAFLISETKRWGDVIDAAGIKPE